MEEQGKDKIISTPRHRGIGKNELKNLQSNFHEEVKAIRSKGRALTLTYK